MKKSVEKKLTSPVLKNLERELAKLEKSENYLNKEKEKLMNQKEIVRNKIKREKEIIPLKQKIERVKGKKT